MEVPSFCPLCKEDALLFLSERKSTPVSRVYWHCVHCDLVFLDPKMRFDAAAEKTHYGFHQNSIHDQKYCEFLNNLIQPLLTRVEEVAGASACGIDYGSGPSPVLAELVRQSGYKMEIFDPFFANDRAVLERQYDFVACCEVVEHMYDPQAGFNQLNALSKSGAILGLMTGMISDWSKFSAWHYPNEATHVCFYSSRTMGWIAKAFDWQLLSIANNVTLFQKN
jgi:hypothetical protein